MVDDGSVDAAAVSAVVARAPHARLVRGGGRGPAAARNLGAAAARGPVLCFTDDDCRPEPGWIEALVASVDDGTAVAGPTQNGRPGDPFAAASQAITNHLAGASLDPRHTAPGVRAHEQPGVLGRRSIGPCGSTSASRWRRGRTATGAPAWPPPVRCCSTSRAPG